MIKKGDTLVEVTLAVGIFSMIAIAIVSVMSSGVSGSQTALETTLTREEIDTQAEALRFIQASHIANKTTNTNPYSKLWETIKSRAIELTDSASDENVLQYRPSTCDALYDKNSGDVFTQNAFVINTKALSNFTINNVNSVYISATNPNDEDKFVPTTTYPRVLYGDSSDNESTESLVGGNAYNQLYQAEGIYVVAVKDKDATVINNDSGSQKTSAFYDFYIRSCWYGSDATTPSTISTVIRLYDPDVAGY